MRTLIIVMLLAVVACGKKTTESNKSQSQNPICGDGAKSLACLSPFKWTVTLRPGVLPENYRIDVYNGRSKDTLHAFCQGGRDNRIYRNGMMIIPATAYFIPQGLVEIEVIDLGPRCRSEYIYSPRRPANYQILDVMSGNRRRKEVEVFPNL